MPARSSNETAEEVARRSYGKLVAYLAARTRDVAAAEDALSEAFAAALRDWSRNGCPANPEAWLLTVARRKAIDAARRDRSAPLEEVEYRLAGLPETAGIPDRRLGLLFACAHPAIEQAVRAPLMLQVVLGLDAAAIASAFLVAPAAMGKRLVRAKSKIRLAGIPFEIPEPAELPPRLDAVLDAIYVCFAEGWSDATGADVERRDLRNEAIFLARMVVDLMPQEPEALGLLALMLHAEARRPARRNSLGEYVPLDSQDTGLWNEPNLAEAERLLQLAGGMGRLGRFQLEAAIQSAHATRRQSGRDNWAEILQLYDGLLTLTASPVVALNRTLAAAEVLGAEAALAGLPGGLEQYQPYWAVRAELLARAGRVDEASEAYEIAIGLARDEPVRAFLERKRSALGATAGPRGASNW